MARLSKDEQAALAGTKFWTYKSSGERVRLMGVVDSWCVARRPSCIPFLVHANEWLQRFDPCPSPQQGEG